MILQPAFAESVEIEDSRLAELGVRLGAGTAENLIAFAMEELAVQLAKIGRSFESGHANETQIAAERISALSRQIGMKSLSIVSKHTLYLCHSRDDTALAAVINRLRRVGESSLMKICDIDDLSG